jgi:tripartite ATP-independent transporter DctP family solute receptor
MKKSFFWVIVLSLVLTQTIIAAPKTYTIKCAYVSPKLTWHQNYQTCYFTTFASYVERASQGRIKAEIYPAGQLGGERELIENCQMGNIQVVSFAEAPLAGFFPKAMVLSTPGLFSSLEEANAIFNGRWGHSFNEELRKTVKIKVLSHFSYGFRHFTNSKKLLRNPIDAKGIKFRVMESPVSIKMVESLNATAVPIPASEMYSALQQGVVDGEENSIMAIIQEKLYEVQKYMILDGHTCSGQFICINDKFYQSLPSDLKEVILAGKNRAEMAAIGVVFVMEEEGLDFLKKYMQIYTPTNKETQKWLNTVSSPTLKYIKTKIGDKAVDELLAGIKSYRAKK